MNTELRNDVRRCRQHAVAPCCQWYRYGENPPGDGVSHCRDGELVAIKHACLTCGRLSEGRRCPKHRRAHARQRKEAGRTGARGSTRAGRKMRAEVLEEAKDPAGVPRCFYDGAVATQVDHFLPLSRGGSDTKDNLVAACAPCNKAKGDQLPAEFMAGRGGRKSRAPDQRTPPGPQARKNSRS
jgi:5-methylcytosine-specific restriction endonuclease McrA